MNLGNKILNNLTSKDIKAAKEAAKELITLKDKEAFELLNQKSEFIFDFLKEKILNTLINAVNKDNILNLFEFLNIYSEDFKSFILEPLIKYSNDEIKSKMQEVLSTGTVEAKAYAVEYFTFIKTPEIINTLKENLKSEFEPLKTSTIRLLAEYKINEEYNAALNALKTETDSIALFEACEFLCMYGNIEAFEPVYNYFVKSEFSEIIASNLLFLKSFDDLINENKDTEALNIYASILKGFPDNIALGEIIFYLNGGLFEYLIESAENLAALLNLTLKSKLKLVIEDESYSIDLSKNDKEEGYQLYDKLGMLFDGFNSDEILKAALKSDNYFENYFALNLIIENKINAADEIKELIKKTGKTEIKILGIKTLKALNELQNDFLKEIKSTIVNENILAEIDSYSV